MKNSEPDPAAPRSYSGQTEASDDLSIAARPAGSATYPDYEPSDYEFDFQDDEAHLTAGDRTLALIDQVIGLQAELAEERYRRDRELEAFVAGEREFRKSVDEANNRASELATRLEEVLASRSWRLGQAVLRPAHVIKSRLIRLR